VEVDILQEVFKNMDPEKSDRIINSALEEFSSNTFQKASTNNIVKRAGISKGLLFHYFKNKQDLYNAIEKFVFTNMIENIMENVDWENSDIFLRIKEVALIKAKVLNRYPYMMKFSERLMMTKSVEEIRTLIETFEPNIYQTIYTKNINFEELKKGIDIEKAVNMVRWVVEKCIEEAVQKLHNKSIEKLDYQVIMDELDDYLDILKATLLIQ